MITTVTVTTKRQLVLPKRFCERARIAPGSQLRVAQVGNGLFLSPILPPSERELEEVIRAAGGPVTREPKEAVRKIKRALRSVRNQAQ
jgi:AbrB family looped-hinge helix DNA binding protein